MDPATAQRSAGRRLISFYFLPSQIGSGVATDQPGGSHFFPLQIPSSHRPDLLSEGVHRVYSCECITHDGKRSLKNSKPNVQEREAEFCPKSHATLWLEALPSQPDSFSVLELGWQDEEVRTFALRM